MRPRLQDIAEQKFDVVVAGGGINGAGIAREAALRGYRTLLVDAEDFGGGTTSRSTRLIHGGLRYLEHGEFALVRESLSDREALLREKRHLVRPLRLLLPVYAGDARPAWKVRIGLWIYDALSLRKSMQRHHGMPDDELTLYEPGLSRDGLRAAYTFYDAQVEFPERLAVESVLDVTDASGAATNHTSLAGIVAHDGKVRGVRLRDERNGDQAEVATRVVVNATGPWADETLGASEQGASDRLVGGTKGSHLVAEWPDGPKHGIFAAARSDGRPFFILPWYRYTLVGTTDLRYDGRASDARCTPTELSYLLEEATRLFPSAPLTRDHVLYTYSGVRPLPYTPSRDESSITRSHFVIDHRKRGGPQGLLSVVGGKLTTYRSLARAAVREIAEITPPSAPRLAGQHRGDHEAAPVSDHLALYGRRAEEVRELGEADPALRDPICEHNPDTLAQVAYAVERELAVTIGDVLLRRLPAGWSRCHAIDGLEPVTRVMAERLGWDSVQREREREAYLREVRETLVPPDDIGFL